MFLLNIGVFRGILRKIFIWNKKLCNLYLPITFLFLSALYIIFTPVCNYDRFIFVWCQAYMFLLSSFRHFNGKSPKAILIAVIWLFKWFNHFNRAQKYTTTQTRQVCNVYLVAGSVWGIINFRYWFDGQISLSMNFKIGIFISF